MTEKEYKSNAFFFQIKTKLQPRALKNEESHSLSPEHVIIGIVDPVFFSWNTANMFFLFFTFCIFILGACSLLWKHNYDITSPDLFFSFYSCKSLPPQLLWDTGQIKAEKGFEVPETSSSLQKTTKSLGMFELLPAWNRSCKPCLFSHRTGTQLTEESHLLAATFILAVKKTETKNKTPI